MHKLMWVTVLKRVKVKKYRHVVGLLGKFKGIPDSSNYEFKLEPDVDSEKFLW